jgi:cytochrome P450
MAVAYPFPPPPSLYEPSTKLAELRTEQPVVELLMPDGNTAWLVTRYEDVRQVLIDPRFSRAAASGPNVPSTGLGDLANDSILGMDPPEHTRLRRLVARAFTARRVEELRPRVAVLVDDLLGQMQDLPRPVDLVEHFSLPLPVQVICELLGVPPEDRHTFHEWSDHIMGDLHADPAQMRAAFESVAGYLAQHIAAKRAGPSPSRPAPAAQPHPELPPSRPAPAAQPHPEPDDDLMSALIAARDQDDRLSEHELVGLCVSILIAGHETTANQINMFLLTLLHYPEQFDRLRKDPDSVPQAVEELMRFVQLGEGSAGMPRVTTEEVELSGVRIPKGAAVLPSLAAANRDPSVHADPDRLDLTRAELGHLGFGAGVHHCLGAQLARMELQEALRGILRWMPEVRVVVPDDQLRFKSGMILRSLETLPVTW